MTCLLDNGSQLNFITPAYAHKWGMDTMSLDSFATNVTDWKQEQKEDPVLHQVVKHLRVPCEMFKAALHKVLDKKATTAYVKVMEQLLIKNGPLYHKTR